MGYFRLSWVVDIYVEMLSGKLDNRRVDFRLVIWIGDINLENIVIGLVFKVMSLVLLLRVRR